MRFNDETSGEFDVIVWATGYRISFPFFDQPEFQADANNVPPHLFKRMIIPAIANPIYVGLAQPLPTLVNFAEQQSKFIAAYITGDYALPSEAEMRGTIAADDRHYLDKYYSSPRHTIQLNFYHYRDALMRKIATGAKRRKRGAPSATFPQSGKAALQVA